MEAWDIRFPISFIVKFRLSPQGGMSIETLGIIGGKPENILNVRRLIFSLERGFGRLGFLLGEITTIQ